MLREAINRKNARTKIRERRSFNRQLLGQQKEMIVFFFFFTVRFSTVVQARFQAANTRDTTGIKRIFGIELNFARERNGERFGSGRGVNDKKMINDGSRDEVERKGSLFRAEIRR